MREVRHILVPVERQEDWRDYHDIRRTVLFEGRVLHAVYDETHPDEYLPGNHPLLLKFRGKAIGTVRLDERGDGTGVVRLVAITENEQRKGHGRVLDKMVQEIARANGIRTLLVNAATAALGYYESMGWNQQIWDAQELAGIAEDCRQMTKRIVPIGS